MESITDGSLDPVFDDSKLMPAEQEFCKAIRLFGLITITLKTQRQFDCWAAHSLIAE
jgi:hypothetical protein